MSKTRINDDRVTVDGGVQGLLYVYKIVLLDHAGRERIVMSAGDSEPYIRLLDSAGETQLKLWLDLDGKPVVTAGEVESPVVDVLERLHKEAELVRDIQSVDDAARAFHFLTDIAEVVREYTQKAGE